MSFTSDAANPSRILAEDALFPNSWIHSHFLAILGTVDLQNTLNWYNSVSSMPVRDLATTRDLFQSRLNNFLRSLLKKFGDNDDVILLVAVVGELGNNCFDHNLGLWQDVPGCIFDMDVSEDKIKIIVADRGQGIFSSLKRVDPSLQNAQEALETAFSKVLSGRFPENRGNGLKFVRQSINGHDKRGLCCLSNGGEFDCGTKGPDLLRELKGLQHNASDSNRGTLTIIEWGMA